MRVCVCQTIFLLVFVLALQAQQSPGASSKASLSSGPDLGAVTNGTYRNAFFGFSVKLPFGWVDRTDVMRDDAGDSANSAPSKGIALLATFERPPEATGSTVNSAIVIAAESTSSYPGLKDAAQYFGPIEELTKANGFASVVEPYEFPVDGMPIVREDFSKKISNNLTMVQSSLALLRKGYIVSFTFIAGSDDEVTRNLEYLSFGTQKSPRQK